MSNALVLLCLLSRVIPSHLGDRTRSSPRLHLLAENMPCVNVWAPGASNLSFRLISFRTRLACVLQLLTRCGVQFGLKNIKHEVRFMPNDDVKTPTDLVGKKIAPILEMPYLGEVMKESMDSMTPAIMSPFLTTLTATIPVSVSVPVRVSISLFVTRAPFSSLSLLSLSSLSRSRSLSLSRSRSRSRSLCSRQAHR
eukprot:2271549-Rhodomonas_salina.2